MRLIVMVGLLMLFGCEGCPPDSQTFIGCSSSCGPAGVHQVTFSKCVCNEPKPHAVEKETR